MTLAEIFSSESVEEQAAAKAAVLRWLTTANNFEKLSGMGLKSIGK